GEADRRTLRDVCSITHRNDEAAAGALLIVRAVRHAAANEPLADLPAVLADLPPDSVCRDRLRTVRDRPLMLTEYAHQFGASGWTADSVPLAILAAAHEGDFKATIGEIVSCGGDTDTIASMFGQIVGAAYGPDALPAEGLGRLEAADEIRSIAERLAAASDEGRA
ncbi:MAG: ADP-ribosylglycohydrolase family protein, partial [Planctomycetota bacterium]